VKTGSHISVGVVTALALFVAIEFVPHGDIAFMLFAALLFLVALIRGLRLPLAVRVFATACIFYWAYIACLIGRTMRPGLTAYTLGWVLFMFAFYGWWPAPALFRLWRPMIAIGLLCMLLPVGFALAAVVASAEECLFVLKYKDTGVGTTERWTISNHWLSYDKESQRLDGSD
jgi:hypothetical protein